MDFVVNFPDCKIFEMTGQMRQPGQSKLFGEGGREEVSIIIEKAKENFFRQLLNSLIPSLSTLPPAPKSCNG